MGVDAAGKETSSMWEIYAVSPRDSDIGDAGRTSARAFADTTGQNHSPHLHLRHPGTLLTPAQVEKNIPGSAEHHCQDWEHVVNIQRSSFSRAFNHI